MPSIYSLKPRFQNLLRPLVRGLAGTGITANQVTLFACIVSVAIGALLAYANAERTPRLWSDEPSG